jgi:two-component system, sensor histidine kinase
MHTLSAQPDTNPFSSPQPELPLSDGPDLTMDELSEITQHLLRFSPDALIVVDERAQIRFANETVTQMFGYPPEALTGKPLETLVPERLRGRHGDYTAGYMRKPDNREMGARISDLFARRADGTEFAAGIRLAPFKIGGRLFVAAAIRDTSEGRRINEALIAAREEADRANRAKSRFLATASHDLRQPLQTIRLLNAALLKIVPEEDVHLLLQQQEHAIESMTRLLNSLLDISRLESGAIEPVRSAVPLKDLCDELHSEFEALARTRDLELRIDALPLAVVTDRTLFYQLLQNIVANALKYTDRGSVCIGCSQDQEALTISVEDTGIGIPADKLERIFDEYYQVDTHGAKRMGVGLGLAIVKEVARLLGLSVKISSILGEGTQVRVRIPRELLVTSTAPAEVTADKPGNAAFASRLLLVEDNDGVRLATELFLKLEGHEILSASNVSEAEKLFLSLRPGDIIIADYHLDTNNTGLDLLLNLRQRVGYEVPGIVLSGDLPSVLRSLKTPVGQCRFLSKPVDTGALLDAITELTGALRKQDSSAVQLSGAQAS